MAATALRPRVRASRRKGPIRLVFSRFRLPVPQILFLGSNVSGTTQNVVVGQQIALTVAPPGNGLTVNNRSWSGVDAGAAIAGWTPGQTPQLPNPSNESFTFYWVNAGTSGQVTYTVTYRWTLDNGQSNSASVTFHVAGPANANVSATVGSVQILPIVGSTIDPSGTSTMLLNGVSTLSGQAGIKFIASTVLPNGNTGSYSWVQLISNDSVHFLRHSGTQACTTFSNSGSAQPELDNTYPYGVGFGNVYTTSISNDTATDGPRLGDPTLSEMARSFSATMYLLWTPNSASGCSGGACAIPLPLGSLSWTWTGDAINTLSAVQGLNSTTWILTGCQEASAGGFQASSVYPVWTDTVLNNSLRCH